MKIILNQYFPLNNTDITEKDLRPNDVQKADAEYLLFLRSDDETRTETTTFLKTHFEKGALTTDIWRHHIRDLKDRKGRNTPSFALIQLTDPVHILLYGFCQVLHCHQGQVLEVFKAATPQTLQAFDRMAVMDGYWLLGYADESLAEPLAKTAMDAMQQQDYPLEEFFYNQIYEAGIFKKFNITIVQVEEIVDLESVNASPYIEKRLTQMLHQVLPTTKTWIDKVLEGKKEPKKDRWGRVIKPDYEVLYKALQPDLELKRREISVLQKQSHYSKELELESLLEQKELQINHLQKQIVDFNQKVTVLELAQKGATTLQKELDMLKQAFDQLILEKTHLIQQLKEAQSAHNQWFTRYESLSKQLDNLQKEKLLLQNQLKTANTDLQQVQNQSVAQNTQLSKQLQDAQSNLVKLRTENVDLQKVQNQSVARYDSLVKQLKTEKVDLQQVQNQFITQNATLSDELKTARTEIERLRKLLDLKPMPQPKPNVIPTPVVPKPIIITPPIIKTKLPFEPEMILVEGGTFKMGSDDYNDEKPIHQVTLSSYAIGKYPITQAQWQAVMGANPSHFKGDNLPVERVSWDDAQDFISKLNSKTGKTYSLPTEAQWEFAARGGTKSKGFEYSGSNNLDEVGWFWENSGDKKLSGEHNWDRINENNCKTHLVGEKKENELGIHDMSGNVWEWCADWYGSYDNAAVRNPIGAVEGSYRVLRGGGWRTHSMYCRVARRDCSSPSRRDDSYGFRVVSFP